MNRRCFLYEVALGDLAPEVHASYRQEPDLQPGAVLVLAQLGDPRAEELARQQLKTAEAPQNVAALEVSLALAGDPSFLKAGHLEIESYSIGYGVLDAIESFQGAHGMELLVAGRHPWARVRQEILVRFERITGAQVVGDGKSRLASQRRMETWWAEHGEQFTRQRRAKAGE